MKKDTKPVPAYVLTVAKGNHKLKEAQGSGNPGCLGVPQNPAPGSVRYDAERPDRAGVGLNSDELVTGGPKWWDSTCW